MHHNATNDLFLAAKLLRKHPTRAEGLLWERLRLKSTGYKFRRQHPLYNFIVDFYCHALRLVIEVDGGIHDDPSIAEYDRQREAILKDLGLNMFRLRNEDIIYKMDATMEALTEYIASLENNEGM